MVNNFAIGLTHLLLAIAAWRLVQWRDLDSDSDIGPVPAAPGAASTSVEQTLPPGRTDTDA